MRENYNHRHPSPFSQIRKGAAKIGLAITALLTIWWGIAAGPAGADNQAAGHAQKADPGLITHFAPATNGQQHTLVVVDPQNRSFAVYQINPTTGENKLSSSRRITWDLQLMEHNSGLPKPDEIREALRQR